MTLADPYPQNLAEVDDQALGFAPPDPTIKALNRIATALEQIALNQLERTQPVQNPALRALAGPAGLAPLPPVQNGGVCPIHNAPWKTVPAGVSKKNGKPYDAFQACSVAGCDQRPPR